MLQASPADTREAVPETNDSAVQGRGDDAVGEVAREVGRLYWPDALLRRRGRRMGSGRSTIHRGREIVRLGAGLTPFRTRNFVRRRPIRSDEIRLISALEKTGKGNIAGLASPLRPGEDSHSSQSPTSSASAVLGG